MGYVNIIIAILIWSSLGIFVRKIDLPTISVIFYPAVIAGGLQFLLLILTRHLGDIKATDKSFNSTVLLFLVPVFFLANTLLFYFAFNHTSIANAVLTHYTAPIFVALMAPVLLGEKVLKTTWFAIVLSSTGLWFILSTSDSGGGVSLSDSESRGILAGALSGLAYALLILTVRTIATRYSSLFIIFIQNSVVAVLLSPFAFQQEITFHSLPYLITLGIVHSTIAPLLYVRGFIKVKANEAAILGYFEPVGAILLALIFLHEIPGMKALLGGVLILYSGFMIVRAGGE